MALLTRWGKQFGEIPDSQGTTWFVAPAASYTVEGRSYSASDDNDGQHPERALRTVAQAITNATASAGDVIYLLEGTHTVTATVAVSKAGLTFVGAGQRRSFYGMRRKPKTTLTIRGTSDELLSITASNTEFSNLRLEGAPDFAIVTFQTANALDNIVFVDSMIDMNINAAFSTNTKGIDISNRAGGAGNTTTRTGTGSVQAATVYIVNCLFETNGAAGPAVEMASCSVELIGCRFHNTAGTWASPVIVATSVDQTLVQGNVWTTSGTMTVAVSGPSNNYAALVADGVAFVDNRITNNLGTTATAFEGFVSGSTVGASLVENYVMGNPSTSANGGTLITRLT